MNAILRRRIRSTVTFVILGAVVGLLIGLVVSRLDERIIFWGSVRGICIGILIGLFLGAGEEFMVPRLSRKLSFLMLNLTRVLSYAAITLMALVIVNAFAFSWASRRTLGDAASLYLSDGSAVRDLVVAIIAAITLTSALQVRRLHNKGEIKRLLTGKYYYPQEESRVFLFADLASSTTHAERLGPLSYSMMLRDLFTDVSEAILAWHGEVYQYAGDEVIISWQMERGVRDAACVQCFVEMVASLEERANQYRVRYELEPELRGAVHGGQVVTAWVGEAKKELAFHGDTLNATARILSLCKDRGGPTSRLPRDPRPSDAAPQARSHVRGRGGAAREAGARSPVFHSSRADDGHGGDRSPLTPSGDHSPSHGKQFQDPEKTSGERRFASGGFLSESRSSLLAWPLQ